jgi:hypothetical protein
VVKLAVPIRLSKALNAGAHGCDGLFKRQMGKIPKGHFHMRVMIELSVFECASFKCLHQHGDFLVSAVWRGSVLHFLSPGGVAEDVKTENA